MALYDAMVIGFKQTGTVKGAGVLVPMSINNVESKSEAIRLYKARHPDVKQIREVQLRKKR